MPSVGRPGATPRKNSRRRRVSRRRPHVGEIPAARCRNVGDTMLRRRPHADRYRFGAVGVSVPFCQAPVAATAHLPREIRARTETRLPTYPCREGGHTIGDHAAHATLGGLGVRGGAGRRPRCWRCRGRGCGRSAILEGEHGQPIR